jgi:hypothetical protein
MARWVLDWQDQNRDADRRVTLTADSPSEAREAVERLLTGATWTPEGAEEFQGPDARAALEAFRDEVMDLSDDDQLNRLWTGVTFECDDGTLFIVRER